MNTLLTIGAYTFEDHLTVGNRIIWALWTLPFTVVAGGALGAVEGVILAFPLAAFLGRFRTAG